MGRALMVQGGPVAGSGLGVHLTLSQLVASPSEPQVPCLVGGSKYSYG